MLKCLSRTILNSHVYLLCTSYLIHILYCLKPGYRIYFIPLYNIASLFPCHLWESPPFLYQRTLCCLTSGRLKRRREEKRKLPIKRFFLLANGKKIVTFFNCCYIPDFPSNIWLGYSSKLCL